MGISVLPAYVFASCVSNAHRKERGAKRVLGIKPRFLGRAASVLNS